MTAVPHVEEEPLEPSQWPTQEPSLDVTLEPAEMNADEQPAALPVTTDEQGSEEHEFILPGHVGGEGGTRRGALRPWLIASAVIVILLGAAGGMAGWYLWKRRSVTIAQPSVQTQTVAPTAAPVAPEGMILIPGGTFLMGRDDGDDYERPAHEVSVKSFFIDKHEVTRAQYSEFLKATGHTPPPTWSRAEDTDEAHGRLPVIGVSWVDAQSYAEWADKRLPTEEEWEYAARGADGRRYPWGNAWQPNAANAARTNSGGFAEVGHNADGGSAFGALDMAGNAWEWTSSTLAPYPGGHLPPSAYENPKVIRGGSWQSGEEQATTTYRRGYPAKGNVSYENTGIRCAKDVP
jgi:formylglycine-generating enzyme required for sulfatase activity